VYTVKFAGAVYVLHVFQKKSESGIRTPAEEIDRIKTRLRQAENHHAEWTKKRETEEQGRR
jgi:phage-related protein